MNRSLFVVHTLLILVILVTACGQVSQVTVITTSELSKKDAVEVTVITTSELSMKDVVEVTVTTLPTVIAESPLPPTDTPTAISNPLMVELKSLQGDIFLNGKSYTGGSLFEKDQVATGPGAFAVLYFLGQPGVYAELRPNTRVYLDRVTPGEVQLYLEAGSMKTGLSNSQRAVFRVTTKAGSVEAYSTEWITEVDPGGNMQVSVLDGKVETQTSKGDKTTVYNGETQIIPVDRPAQAPQRVILVALDESHGLSACQVIHEPCDFSYYSKLSDAVKQSGFVLDSVTDLEWLKWYQVLIMIHPSIEYSSNDLSLVQSWVKGGGGLFFAGEHAWHLFLQDSANQLLEPFGIKFMNKSDEITRVATSVINHPVMQDIAMLRLDYTNNLEGGLVLAKSDSGLAVLVAAEPGGRLLVFSDATSLGDDIFDENTKTLITNAIPWLARLR